MQKKLRNSSVSRPRTKKKGKERKMIKKRISKRRKGKRKRSKKGKERRRGDGNRRIEYELCFKLIKEVIKAGREKFEMSLNLSTEG